MKLFDITTGEEKHIGDSVMLGDVPVTIADISDSKDVRNFLVMLDLGNIKLPFNPKHINCKEE